MSPRWGFPRYFYLLLVVRLTTQQLTFPALPMSPFFSRILKVTGILIVAGCNYSDEVEELSGGYFYRGEGGATKDILAHSPGKQDIYGEVVSYDYNADFIVALQKPDSAEHKSMLAFELREHDGPQLAPEEELRVSEIAADSIVKRRSFYKNIFAHKFNHWIIAHHPHRMYGPLTEASYFKLRAQLHVPESVQLPTP